MPLSKSNAFFRIVYIVLSVLMITLYLIFRYDAYLFIVLFAVVLFSWVVVYRLLAKRRNMKALQILTHQCDPEAFISKIQKLLQDRSARKRPTYLLGLQLLFVQGLIQSGKYAEAKAALPPAPVNPISVSHRMLAIMHASLFSYIFLHGGLFDNAVAAIEAMRSLADPKVLRKKYAAVQRTVSYSECLLALHRGQYEGMEVSLLRFFDTADSPLSRANVQANLGELYLQLNQPEKAKAAFHYAAEHGNKLYAAMLAREALNQLEQA